MPTSDDRGKDDTFAWIEANVSADEPILDIGAGAGYWGRRLGPKYKNVDALEVWEPYITEFNLCSLYRKVILGDILNPPFNSLNGYSLFVCGDIIEHISRPRALLLLYWLRAFTKNILVSVPWLYPQGAYEGNKYEIHLQPDLTKDLVEIEYRPDEWLFCDDVVGVFRIRGCV